MTNRFQRIRPVRFLPFLAVLIPLFLPSESLAFVRQDLSPAVVFVGGNAGMCRNDPVGKSDPRGLWAWDDDWLELGILAPLGFAGTRAERDAARQAYRNDFMSGDMGRRGMAAAAAETKIIVGVGEAVLGAKATVASGGLAAGAGYVMVVDAASRTAGGVTDYASIFTDRPLQNGDVIEDGFKMALGERHGSNARDITSTILTCGTSALLLAEREAARASEVFALQQQQAAKTPAQVLQNQAAGNTARDAIAASRPGSVIEQNFRVTGGLRRVDVLDGVTAIESKVGRTSLTPAVRQELARDIKMMRSGQIEGVQWHFSPSPTTGIGGPTGPLRAKLDKFGIPIVE